MGHQGRWWMGRRKLLQLRKTHPALPSATWPKSKMFSFLVLFIVFTTFFYY